MPNVRGGNGTGFGGAASAGRNSSTSSAGARSGDARGATRSAPVAAGGNQYAGYRGPIGTNTPTAAAPGSYGLSGPETRAYNAAKTEYQNRGLGKRVVDFFSPLKSVDPQINQPSSYQGGQYHHGINPAGMIAGMLSPYGSGLLTGPLAGSLYNQQGGHNVVMTGGGSGWSTSYPDGGPGYNSSTGYGGPAGQPTSPQGKGQQGGTPGLPGLTGNPGGAPFGAQPPVEANNHMMGQPNSFFSPQLPNHTVPQGYQSAFPNSLTEQDKRLLYAKALGGGMG